jgi:hypothetical protein
MIFSRYLEISLGSTRLNLPRVIEIFYASPLLSYQLMSHTITFEF